MGIDRKIKNVSIAIVVLLIAGIFRFFDICIIKGNEYLTAAERQRVTGTELEPVRGNILDRNMIPLTNRTENLISYVMPNSSVYDIHTTIRYNSNSVARYVTGYVKKDGAGETGVEGFYNDWLKVSTPREIVVVKDARSRPIKGFGYTITESDEKPFDLRLTLDYNIQKVCEEVFEANNLSGAFVFQEAASGDILAMGSYPEYEHGQISDYLESKKGELTNRATSAYNLGSVYKIITAACAIEKNLDLEYSYYCTGAIDVTGLHFRCNKRDGHGIVSFKNAFANSCNPYFIDLGIEMGMAELVNMGTLFGFGSQTGLFEQGINESAGNLPDLNGIINDRAVANVSMGQGEILTTPLQVTNAVSAVANGGVLVKPNIVDSIIDSKGNVVKRIKNESSNRIIKESTAEMLTELMGEVCLTGTAKEGLSAWGLSGVYGKTGSAETGKVTDKGQIVHSWFSAFFERDGKRYTLTVFLENGVTLSQSSVKIFGEIVSLTSTK